VWRDSFDGWTVTTRRDVAKPKAGQLVRFEVTVVPPRSGAYHVGVLWGDNMGSDNPIASDCGTGPKASAGRAFTVGFAHAWRVSRTYSVTVQPGVGCEAGKAPAYPKHTVAVTTGRVRGNGPQAPWGRVDYGPKDTGDAAADHYFSAQGTDNDGYVARLVFDWGDGSKATTVDFVSGCRRPPDDSWIEYPNSVNDVHHKYAKAPSSYTITMTVVSSGCRGEDEQRMAVRWRPTRTEVGPYSSPEPRT
jgi:hypothetical protein